MQMIYLYRQGCGEEDVKPLTVNRVQQESINIYECPQCTKEQGMYTACHCPQCTKEQGMYTACHCPPCTKEQGVYTAYHCQSTFHQK